MQADTLSLLELNDLIKGIIKSGTEKSYWIFGEISEIKVNYSGHCYLELIQKDKESDQIVARSRATIWSSTFRLLKPYFETTTGQPFMNGLAILVKTSVEFHEVYGLSLNILDIEPTFTVGELALQKQKVINRLTEEGVIGMNHELELPVLCQKIAVISSETAAGYGDFIDQLTRNAYGYKFYYKLFRAVMQGEEAEKSIIRAFDRIYQYESFFDAVVIIRGGGSQADLSCFNSYWLAYHITQFPIPILTGIGHEQDDSVADLVAHTRLKTPTAVAEFLVDHMAQAELLLHETVNDLIENTRNCLDDRRNALLNMVKDIQLSLKDILSSMRSELTNFDHLIVDRTRKTMHALQLVLHKYKVTVDLSARNQIKKQFKELETVNRQMRRELINAMKRCKHELESMNDRMRILDPVHVLGRGYSITFKDGKVLKDTENILEGDLLDTVLYKGKIQSTIKNIRS